MSGLFTKEIRSDEAAQQRNRDWIAALRSGSYKQGQGQLRLCDIAREVVSENVERITHTNCKWCCLGVVCDIVDSDSWFAGAPIWDYDDDDNSREVSEFTMDGAAGHLPERVRVLLCFATRDGSFDHPAVVASDDPNSDDDAEDTLIGLNDNRRWNFSQIADVIERELTEALA